MNDFAISAINVNSGSSAWGPFSFDFSTAIPTGDSIASVVITSLLSEGSADSTSVLIASGSGAISRNAAEVWFNYPGKTFVGAHTLCFELTLASGAKQAFRFNYVMVAI